MKFKYAKEVKLGIAGPGRSGTSLLTLLFSEFGFSTAVGSGDFNEEARAGYESRIDGSSEFEIDKDPWLFEYIESLPEGAINNYQLILLPIRRRQDAVISRVSQERTARAISISSEHWKWNSWGNTPGGAISGTDFESVNQILSNGLWDLIEACERKSIPYRFIHFPRFAEDFDYLWSQIGSFAESKISKEAAKERFMRVVELNKIRIRSDEAENPKILELEAIIANLQRRIHSTDLREDKKSPISPIQELDQLAQERDQLAQERDQLEERLFAVLNSRTWKFLKWYRRIKQVLLSRY